jgi:hypothetical protein
MTNSTVISKSPMLDLYLGKAVSNDDCDGLASHARNRLQSDRTIAVGTTGGASPLSPPG